MGSYGQRPIVIGGDTEPAEGLVEVMDMTNFQWGTGPNQDFVRKWAAYAITSSPEAVYVAGGLSRVNNERQSRIVKLQNDVWTQLGNLQYPRQFGGYQRDMVLIGDELIIIGGYYDRNGYVDDLGLDNFYRSNL